MRVTDSLFVNPVFKQQSQFQKSVVVVPAKAGHEVTRNNIQHF